jgi:proteasome accessory factor B
MRRYATLLDAGVAGPDGTSEWDRLEVAYSAPGQLAEDVLAFGPNAYAESPEEARTAVIDRLSTALGGSA